jgi:hypothetical protein
MLRLVSLLRTNVSGERIALYDQDDKNQRARNNVLRGMFRLLVTANVVPSSPILFALMIEVICSFETSILTIATRCHIPEDGILHGFFQNGYTASMSLRILHGDSFF